VHNLARLTRQVGKHYSRTSPHVRILPPSTARRWRSWSNS
jgi:hypothetical protein